MKKVSLNLFELENILESLIYLKVNFDNHTLYTTLDCGNENDRKKLSNKILTSIFNIENLLNDVITVEFSDEEFDITYHVLLNIHVSTIEYTDIKNTIRLKYNIEDRENLMSKFL